MLALENDSGDRQRWMQKGVSHQPAERDVNDLSCVSELPDAVGSYAEYVPPEGFDCEPVKWTHGESVVCRSQRVLHFPVEA